jgi:hypothetical protein
MNLLGRIWQRLNAVAGVGKEETLFFEMKSADPLPDSPFPPDVRIQELESKQIPDFCNSSPMDRKSAEKRWASEDKCYLAYLEGRLAHYSWVKTAGVQPVTEADIQVPVLPGEFWIYDCWTSEWARGRKLYPCMLVLILSKYFGDGLGSAHIYTTRTNLASQRGIARAGFRYTSSKWSLRVGSHWFSLK